MSGESVKVIVRCRPMNKRENDLKCKTVVSMGEGITCYLKNPEESGVPAKDFHFDGAYDVNSTTEQIYNDVGFGLVESVLEGYNGTVFAYGQTGCGKSFTMQGITEPASQRGIIPRSFEHIFEVIQTSEDMKYLVHASYLEIYNEEIRDLLGPDVKKKLDLKEHPERGVFVNGLTQHPVHNTCECERLMEKGWSNRSTGATLMNADSSRSHSIFTIALEMMHTAGESDAIKSGKLNLVDLAGSERQAKTGATGDRLKEATKINLSLSALGNVISALVDGKSKHIPYRDSKLTRLLQDSLGGNTKTLMVACLSPADNNYDETLSTLRYANRAKNIKNKPVVNEDPKDAMLKSYREEIRKLKEMLDQKGPQETVVKVAPDETALEQEREKVRLEYEEKMRKMKEDMEAERESNVLLQTNMDELKKKYEEELQAVNQKIEEEQKQLNNNFMESKRHSIGIETVAEDGTIIYNAEDPVTRVAPAPPSNVNDVVKTTNAEMMTSMQEEALKRLKELEKQMVGGEKAQDNELKAKRMKRKKYMEKRKKILTEALKNVDDEDGLMQKVYDDIHEELKAKTDLAKKQKQKIKSMEKEVKDLTEEFQNERSDYLETIRKQDQQVKLLQAILERVQPTIRKDCNYSDLDTVKKEAIWDDEYMRWKVPDLSVSKTKLPPAGGIQLGGRFNAPQIPQASAWGSAPNTGSILTQEPLNLEDPDSQDEDDPYLQQKLQRGEEEDIAGSYFRPKRAKELLFKYKGGNNPTFPERSRKSTTNNYNLSMSQGMLGSNMNNLNSSFSNTQGGTFSNSWAPGGSTGSHGISNTFGGSGGALNNMGNVVSNGWLGDNGFSSNFAGGDGNLRRPNRLDALPSLDGRTKKKSRDVLHTLDLI